MPTFAQTVIAWQKQAGRHDLPWQNTRDPYRIWVSEVMLQQTQVASVIPYFERFMARFPNIKALAQASEEAVLTLWSGLGYYARARHLHRAAQQIMAQHSGAFPSQFRQILDLPGVGRSTAGAIAVFAWGQAHPILDGNVKRVLARVFALPGYPGTPAVAALFWEAANQLLPKRHLEAYTQGLMDIGATLCTQRKPRCEACPLKPACEAHATDTINEYPEAKTRRGATPQKEFQMLLVFNGRSLLLERRPAKGIWAGLWSFPEVEMHEDPVAVLKKRWGLKTQFVDTWPVVRHALTHRQLMMTPCRLTAKGCALPAGLLWMDVEDIAGAAVPVPVRKILKLLG
jgi:A/G-specific adenine glycosylase